MVMLNLIEIKKIRSSMNIQLQPEQLLVIYKTIAYSAQIGHLFR
jgi:hypothetical protein